MITNVVEVLITLLGKVGIYNMVPNEMFIFDNENCFNTAASHVKFDMAIENQVLL